MSKIYIPPADQLQIKWLSIAGQVSALMSLGFVGAFCLSLLGG